MQHVYTNFYPTMHNIAPILDSNVTLTVRDYQERWLIIQVNWNQYIFPAQYSVFWASTHESSVTTTYNNSVQLLLSYNSEYNVSLLAGNCAGSSAPVSVLFRVGKLKLQHPCSAKLLFL